MDFYIEFYICDCDTGRQLGDDMCGCPNSFTTIKKAAEVCKRVSKKYAGRYSVNVVMSSVTYVNGRLEV